MGKRKRLQNDEPTSKEEIGEQIAQDCEESNENVKVHQISKAGLNLKSTLKSKLEKRLIVVLEKANIESIKVGNTYQLLNCDDHLRSMKKFKKNPAECRPDILHQCLLMLQDSPLNQAGLLQVYIHTDKNVLIEVHPQCRIPRTFKRFAGLMVQLLHRFSVRASEGGMKLMKVIKNPVEDHLPVGCRKICMSYSSPRCVNPRKFVPDEEPIVVVIGSMAHGRVEVSYVEEEFSISKYHLSAALTCAKVCSAFEEVWQIT